MDGQLWTIVALTFIIHLIGTLAYSVRIAGTRTGRIAVSFALFNLLVLVSRTSNSFQTPLIAKRVEEDLALGRFRGGVVVLARRGRSRPCRRPPAEPGLTLRLRPPWPRS